MCTGGKVKFFGKDEKKKFQSAFLDPPGRYTGNNFLFKGGLMLTTGHQVIGIFVDGLLQAFFVSPPDELKQNDISNRTYL